MQDPDILNPYASPARQTDETRVPNAEARLKASPNLRHVFQCLLAANQMNSSQGIDPHVDALERCEWVLSLACKMTAYDRTGVDAVQYLRELSLICSENVGDAIVELQKLGLSKPSNRDQPGDFENLYHLDRPNSEWRLDFNFVSELKQYEIVEFDNNDGDQSNSTT